MAHASVLWIVFISVSSSDAYSQYNGGFYYSRTQKFFWGDSKEECGVCYGSDCFVMDWARCKFYTSTLQLVNGKHDDEDAVKTQSSEQIRREVDYMMMNWLEQVSTAEISKECIPLISKYTDCTKENACLGCTSCSCNEEGRWNCSTLQQCEPDSLVDVDHRTLVLAMEALRNKDISLMRNKRSITIEEPVTKPSKISYDDLSEWLYGVKPLYSHDPVTTSTEKDDTARMNMKDAGAVTTVTDVFTPNHTTKSIIESDYLAFEDILNIIGIEDKIYNRKKQLNIPKDTTDHDFINVGDNYATLNTNNDNYLNILNAIERENDEGVIKSMALPTTEVVIDLLEVARKKISNGSNFTTSSADIKEMFNDKRNLLTNTSIENTNVFYDYNMLNIKKRDISQVIHDNSSYTSNYTQVQYFADILEAIDKNMPLSHALSTLSPQCRKIIERVIDNYKNVYSVKNNYKLKDLEYQFTNDLTNVGFNWQTIFANILNMEPDEYDTKYSLKLLYLVLLADIKKMTDALQLMNFSSSRRLFTIHDELNEGELKRINKGLKVLHATINKILKLRPVPITKPENRVNKGNGIAKPRKTESYLKYIRKLLRNTKKDIIELLVKKNSKPDFVKTSARKKLDELTKKKLIEDESIMQKWQRNLNVRKKRFVVNFENIKRRIKNILPKYLREKLYSSSENPTQI